MTSAEDSAEDSEAVWITVDDILPADRVGVPDEVVQAAVDDANALMNSVIAEGIDPEDLPEYQRNAVTAVLRTAIARWLNTYDSAGIERYSAGPFAVTWARNSAGWGTLLPSEQDVLRMIFPAQSTSATTSLTGPEAPLPPRTRDPDLWRTTARVAPADRPQRPPRIGDPDTLTRTRRLPRHPIVTPERRVPQGYWFNEA